MLDKIFLIDDSRNLSYLDFFNLLANVNELPRIIYESDIAVIFAHLISSIIHDKPVTILDSDFSRNELDSLNISQSEMLETYHLERIIVNSENLLSLLKKSKDWKLTIYTSGTTGIPKKITHSFNSLTRMVRIKNSTENNIWGFAYSPTHIAGLQVFFQAIMNLNSLVNLFGKSRGEIYKLIEKYKITNISATPTFYRMLLPIDKSYCTVTKLTSGGEKFDEKLSEQLLKLFPNSKLLNIYASTEAGTILASKGNDFIISEKYLSKIKIINSELVIHKDLLGHSESLNLKNNWYFSGDEVKIISENPLIFRFVKRKYEMINIGGFKVNPLEIEELLNSHNKIKISRVYSKKNSVSGNVLIADVLKKEDISEKDIQLYLRKRLQGFKVPRIINFVDEINLTRSGKLKRL